jgi:hypothetical protein
MLEYEDEEMKAIVAYVKGAETYDKSTREPIEPRYGIIKRQFGWGQDKCVKHWKKARAISRRLGRRCEQKHVLV